MKVTLEYKICKWNFSRISILPQIPFNIYVFSFIFLTCKLNINYKEHFISILLSSQVEFQAHQQNDVYIRRNSFMLAGCRNLSIYLSRIINAFNYRFIIVGLNRYNTKFFIDTGQKYELHQPTNIIRKW